MGKQAQALIRAMVLLGSLYDWTRPESQPASARTVSDAGALGLRSDAAVVASRAIRDAAPAVPEGACDVMRRTADHTRSTHRAWPHLADRRLERAIRRFYARRVLARGIDDRSLAQHPVVFERGGTAAGVTVAPCVEQWRGADPSGVVPSRALRLAADQQYAEIEFELDDASDGEYAYTAFVDVATREVVAMFYYGNFQP